MHSICFHKDIKNVFIPSPPPTKPTLGKDSPSQTDVLSSSSINQTADSKFTDVASDLKNLLTILSNVNSPNDNTSGNRSSGFTLITKMFDILQSKENIIKNLIALLRLIQDTSTSLHT